MQYDEFMDYLGRKQFEGYVERNGVYPLIDEIAKSYFPERRIGV